MSERRVEVLERDAPNGPMLQLDGKTWTLPEPRQASYGPSAAALHWGLPGPQVRSWLEHRRLPSSALDARGDLLGRYVEHSRPVQARDGSVQLVLSGRDAQGRFAGTVTLGTRGFS